MASSQSKRSQHLARNAKPGNPRKERQSQPFSSVPSSQAVNASAQQMTPKEFWQISANVIEEMHGDLAQSAKVEEGITPQIPTPGRKQGWLRSRVVMFILLLGSAPLAAALGTAFYQHSLEAERVQEEQLERSQAQAIALAEGTQDFIQLRLKDIQTLSNLPLLVNLKVWYGLTPSERQGALQQYLETYQVYKNITYVTPEGSVLLQTSGAETGNQAQQPYFQAALEADQAIYTVSPQGQFDFAAPIRDAETGNLLGIIHARLAEAALYDALKMTAADADETELFLLDSGDRYVMTPPNQSELLGQSVKSQWPGLLEALDKPQAAQQLASEDEAEDVSVAHATVLPLTENTAPQPSLTSLVQQPIEDLPDIRFEVNQRLSILLLLGLATATLAIPAMGLFWAMRMSKVLRATSTTLNKLGEGELNARVDLPQGKDELSQLAQALNHSAQSIQHRFSQQQVHSASQAERFLAIARSRDLEEIRSLLTPTLNEFQQVLEVDRMVVYRFTPDKDGYVVGESVSDEWPSVVDLDIRDNCIPESIKQEYAKGKIVQNDNVFHIDAALDPEHLWLLASLEIKANLIVPIIQDDDLLGLLIANDCIEPHPWSEAEIAMMHHFAQQLAMPLHSYFAYEKRRLIAQEERQQSQDLQAAIAQLLAQVEGVAAGDLTVRADSMDGDLGVIAEFFNSLVENLCHIIMQVQEAASKVDGSVLENDSSIRELAADSAQQAEKIANVLDSVEVMTAALQAVAERAQQAAEASQQSAQTAEAGGIAMEHTVDSILQVRDAVAETAKKVKRLGESSQQISKVVELINQIALKTNMLAVNAGIEASKAGDEGRGFAIVAEEVGALASQSAAATQQIEQIIAAIQQGTTEVVEAMENSTSQVVDGSRSVQEAKDSLQNILSVSQQVNQAFQDISAETISQAETSTTVKQLMAEMTHISQDASQASQVVSQSLQQTVQVTQQLQASVQTFKVDDAKAKD